MNLSWKGLVAASLLVAAGGCSTELETGGGGTATGEIRGGSHGASTGAAAWQRLTGDESGRALVAAYREHAPSRDERRLAAVTWLLLVRAEQSGEVHPLLASPALRDALSSLRSEYSLLAARGGRWEGSRPRRHGHPRSPGCDDDCARVGPGVLRSIADIEEAVAPALPSMEEAASALWERLALVDDAAGREWSADEIARLISHGDARRALEALGAAVVPASALREATVALRPEGVGRREVAALAATLGVLVIGSAVEEAVQDRARAVRECRQWQRRHCEDGDADAGSDEDAGADAGGGDDGGVSPTGPQVRVVYIVPTDKTASPLYVERLTRALEHVQRFYHSELGEGRTFLLHDPVVEVRESVHPTSYYATSPVGDDPAFAFWYNVVGDGFSLTGGSYGDPGVTWLYYVDADNGCGQIGGAGTLGVAAFPANDLRGLAGEPLSPICPDEGTPDLPPLCRWVGGMAHELGHALGLPHPPGCDQGSADCDYGSTPYNSLMWMGYSTYPATYLLPEDVSALRASPFLVPSEPRSGPFDCNAL